MISAQWRTSMGHAGGTAGFHTSLNYYQSNAPTSPLIFTRDKTRHKNCCCRSKTRCDHIFFERPDRPAVKSDDKVDDSMLMMMTVPQKRYNYDRFGIEQYLNRVRELFAQLLEI